MRLVVAARRISAAGRCIEPSHPARDARSRTPAVEGLLRERENRARELPATHAGERARSQRLPFRPASRLRAATAGSGCAARIASTTKLLLVTGQRACADLSAASCGRARLSRGEETMLPASKKSLFPLCILDARRRTDSRARRRFGQRAQRQWHLRPVCRPAQSRSARERTHRGARARQRRIQSRHVGHRRESRWSRLRSGLHRRQSWESVARQPRDLCAEGEYR